MRKLMAAAVLFAGCAPAFSQIQFRDITAQAGLRFTHNNAAFGKKYLPETMGPGCAFIDYDGDGYADILLVNGEDWPAHKRSESTLKLYHNNHEGTFTDVTASAGLAISLFGLGVAVGDYDNDGHDDIFISTLGQSHLFHNNGNGKFKDATQKAGMYDPTSKTLGVAILDYNGDGLPDIFLANDTQPNKLYLNRGNGTFEEKAVASGVAFSEDGIAR